jgi:hypothetical protein
MDEWSYERDLKLDPFTSQAGCAGQGCDLVKGALKLRDSLHQRRALEGALSGLTPRGNCLLYQSRFRVVTRQQLWLGLGNLGEMTFDGFRNAGVQLPSRLSQRGAVGGVLHQGVLEQVTGMGWYALSEQQASCNQTV